MLVKSRIWRLLLVTAIFVIVGPPVGGIIAWTSMGAFSLKSPMSFIAGSYGEGILLALLTGLLVAFAGLWLASRSWKVPVLAALAANATLFVLTANMDLSRADYLTTLLDMGRVSLPPSLAAALVCWFLARPLLRDPSQRPVNSDA